MDGATFWTLNHPAHSTIFLNHGSRVALICPLSQRTLKEKVGGGICHCQHRVLRCCTRIAKPFEGTQNFQLSTPKLGKVTKGKGESIFKSIDIALGGVNVFGWSVEVEGKGEVGKVVEILHIGKAGSIGEEATYEYVLKVSQASVVGSSELRSREQDLSNRLEHFGTEILLPIVDEFVKHVDAKQKRLLVKPPDGLLELANRPEAIRQLLPEIQQFCRRHARFLQERFRGNKMIKCDASADLEQMVYTYMPTRAQLQAVGRFDLARRIQATGGFLFVAQCLGLKSTRRPNGFWDDLEKLDNEIEQFLQQSWVQKVHEETGMIYFENFATKEVALKRPIHNAGRQSSLGSSECPRVMPQQMILWRTHRWDLHHAIIWNGGYKEVARALSRSLLRTSKKLRQEQQDTIKLLAKKHTTAMENIKKAN